MYKNLENDQHTPKINFIKTKKLTKISLKPSKQSKFQECNSNNKEFYSPPGHSPPFISSRLPLPLVSPVVHGEGAEGGIGPFLSGTTSP